MKRTTILLILSLFSFALFAADLHQHGDQPMSHAMAVPLKAAKKPSLTSRHKLFLLQVPQVPAGNGKASFTVQVSHRDGSPLSPEARVGGKYWMPGMEMQTLPGLEIRQMEPGRYALGLELSMAGYWKVELEIEDQGNKDKALIKFVTE